MMAYIWLSIFILALVIEIAAPALVSIWFAAGGLASLVLAIFIGDKLIWLQIVVFVLVTVLTILLLRPVIYKNTKQSKTNIDSLIGKIAVCVDDIVKYSNGTVKVEGIVWNAVLDDSISDTIKKGDLVAITDIDGNKLKVKLFKEENK